MKMIIDSRSNNQWKENAFVLHSKTMACTLAQANVPDVARIFFRGIKCPIPAVCTNFTNKFIDEPVAFVFPNAPIMPYGIWRFRTLSGLGGDTIGCWVVEAVTIPKV
ncbi:hypothetical protein ONE63_001062 [Megalurothrips usitatus]|uniref:Uncharacterized protein n=1 Tax=Megalurothrips usitatus TaxID=439358 RepID=A0AAV7XAY4_9NEOP|nr:hypothetical protein ONE63_001062 [Megalurothrips usitatus]